MNINFEKVPVITFDWIEKFSFAELSISQKEEVLKHFSESDYEQMHQASVSVKLVSHVDSNFKSARKDMVMGEFDSYHLKKLHTSKKWRMANLWQAAAIFLFLISGWLFYQIFDLKKERTLNVIASVDTVYIEREIASNPEIIHDTVYRYKEAKTASKKEPMHSDNLFRNDANQILGKLESPPLLELESLNNSTRGNSMKDDSLLRKFSFVSM
ncbi:hypothetical protein [Aurantibacillus circumpalustris]|uniref:hypothetical protein n=1 Tax=Aurantibacillus circumpalustris TaxID=3036359 RepID=UPI00295B459D|nr:hypothetical protein [Aurantibacillus circumpalustris]